MKEVLDVPGEGAVRVKLEHASKGKRDRPEPLSLPPWCRSCGMSKGWKYSVSVTVAIVAVGLLAGSIARPLMQ